METKGKELPRGERAARPTRFVILTSGRSGSSWLMEMLNSHPAIGGYGELFSLRHSTRYPQTRAAQYGDPGGVPFFGAVLEESSRSSNPLTVPYLAMRYMERLYAPRGGLEAIGFRLRYGHLGPRWRSVLPLAAWMFPYMATKRVHVIHLVRRNSLDFLVSREVAVSRGIRHARVEDDLPATRVSLDTDRLLSQLRRRQGIDQLMRTTISVFRLPCKEVTYEDLLADTNSVFREVVRFLGVSEADREPRWEMRKVIETSREETIENYESVRRLLEGTKYRSFLEPTK